jgi:hypothetical protein
MRLVVVEGSVCPDPIDQASRPQRRAALQLADLEVNSTISRSTAAARRSSSSLRSN